MRKNDEQHYDVSAEQSVLGALMNDYGVFEAIQPLSADHFSLSIHKLIFEAITQLVAKKKTPEPVLICNLLGADLDEYIDIDMSGKDYVQALGDSVPRQPVAYAAIVRDKAKERQLLTFSEDVKNIVAQNLPIDDKLESVAVMLEGISKKNIKRMPRHIQQIALKRSLYYENVQSGNVIPGWPTYIPALDDALTGGLKPAKLVILAARPGVGKSSFSWQIANSMAAQGKVTLFLSMEMPEDEIADRAVSNSARVNYQSLLTGKMTPDDWTRSAEALEEMGRRPLYVDDQPALTILDIRTKARSIPELNVLVVDYLQLCDGIGDKRNNVLEEITRGLKALAKELNICVIALSQLNRDGAEGRPKLHHLRDSGAIEQDADIVMFLWEVKVFDDGRKLIGLGIDKNRQGRRCDISLDFDGSIQRWGQSEEKIYQKKEAKTYSKGFTSHWNG